jgi:hypothetical protein
MKKNHVRLIRTVKYDDNDDGYVKMSRRNRLAFIWELTAEIWSLKNKHYVERRLQRHITNLIKK